MSVLIRGMKMPKNCETCKYQTKGACFALGVNKGAITIRRMDKDRPDWCPLVEVPEPHGRLIDADKLKLEYPHDEDWEYPVTTNERACETIDEQPTIIEAESEG